VLMIAQPSSGRGFTLRLHPLAHLLPFSALRTTTALLGLRLLLCY